MDDKKYWTEYYAKNSKPTTPSTFAQFILPKLKKGKKLIELGCGNGRDSIYFAKNSINVIAIDQVQDEIDYLNNNHKEENIHFICDDFTNLVNSGSDLITDSDVDYIYSRFTFHAINEIKEDSTLDWIEKKLNKKGYFFLEARSVKDPMYNQGKALSETENFTDHYRRFMDLDNIISKLESRNFEILFKIEDKDLAVYKDDNPYLIRIIAKKL